MVDVADGSTPGRFAVSARGKGPRVVHVVDTDRAVVERTVKAPPEATAFDLCDDRVVFVDANGLIDERGTRLVTAPALFNLPDPSVLPAQSLCPTAGERLLVTPAGFQIATLKADVVVDVRTLRFAHQARAYTGAAPQSLRPERPYDSALSLYAPRLHAVDVDGDGDTDLVVHHERRLAIFVRGKDGRLDPTAVERDLGTLLGLGSGDVELRLRFASTSGGARAFGTIVRGALPESSTVFALVGGAGGPLSAVVDRRAVTGLAVLLGTSSSQPLLGQLDTSLVALSGVVLTGRVPIAMSQGGDAIGTIQAKADVRAGRIHGAMPIVDVDVDGDGATDLVHLAEPGEAMVAHGMDLEHGVRIPVTAFSWALAAPQAGVVILVRSGARSTLQLLGGGASSSGPSKGTSRGARGR